ncbi:MAG: hypothetical protein IT373_36800 [Polyangiaceae bacterium]|nr:hypothetical protein [Polyangiaceae bacterium]
MGNLPSDAPWREGEFVVAPRHGARFPLRCVNCNSEARRTFKVAFERRRSSGLGLKLVLGHAGHALAEQQHQRRLQTGEDVKLTFEVGICPRHRTWRIVRGVMVAVAVAELLVLVTIGAALKVPACYLVAPPIFLAIVVPASLLGAVGSLDSARDDRAWLRFGKAFTDSLWSPDDEPVGPPRKRKRRRSKARPDAQATPE